MKKLIFGLVFISSSAFAGHHHHHHSSSSNHSSGEAACTRWGYPPIDAGPDDDGGFDDGGLEELETEDGGTASSDAGLEPPGQVWTCLERAPAFGCSAAPGSSLICLGVLFAALGASRRAAANETFRKSVVRL